MVADYDAAAFVRARSERRNYARCQGGGRVQDCVVHRDRSLTGPLQERRVRVMVDDSSKPSIEVLSIEMKERKIVADEERADHGTHEHAWRKNKKTALFSNAS